MLTACSSSESASKPEGKAACPLPGSGGDLLIDDFEDGDGFIKLPRVGYWGAFNSGTPIVQSPPSGTIGVDFPASDDGTGNFAAHTSGSEQASVAGRYALIAALLRHDVGQATAPACAAYDASSFTGVRFRVKGSTTSQLVQLQVPTLKTQGVMYGGTCSANCEDHFVVNVPVSANWTTASFHWSDLHQLGFGQAVSFEPAQILAVQWEVASDQGPEFDFWIDDVSFTTN